MKLYGNTALDSNAVVENKSPQSYCSRRDVDGITHRSRPLLTDEKQGVHDVCDPGQTPVSGQVHASGQRAGQRRVAFVIGFEEKGNPSVGFYLDAGLGLRRLNAVHYCSVSGGDGANSTERRARR